MQINAETEKQKQPQANGFVQSRKELLELHKLVIEEVRKMTPEEWFKDLIASGIYTPGGKLTKEYGGLIISLSNFFSPDLVQPSYDYTQSVNGP